ncbi:hypothetical protein IWX90DRAFT_320328 [Phyllosticta citrichinensis]|uniref:Uncharacterized protein n=1 Tax=Phyllosticta citrichinensis TaxID=1130410 RepID=A0ABR1XJH6_9PEZI
MPLAQLATIAQAGSLFTATRSLWELTRMVRNKRRQSRQTQKVEQLLDELETFVDRGVLTRKEWTSFCLQVEKSIADAEATPLEAQAQVLDFIEALENIDQEFADSEYESDTSDEGGHKSRRRRRHQRRSSEPTLHSESFNDARRSLNRSHSVQDPHAGLVPQSRGIPPMPVALPSQFQNRQLYGYGRPAFHPAAAAPPPPPPPVHEDPRAGVGPTGYAMPRYGVSASTTVAPNMSNPSFAANTSRNNSLAAAYRRPRPVPRGSSLSSSNTRKVTTNSSSDPRPSHLHHPGRHDARPASSDSSSAYASSSFSSGTASPVSPIDSSSSSRSSSTSSVASGDYVLHPSRDAQQQQQHSNLHHPKPRHIPAPQTDRQPRVFYFPPPPPPPNAPAMAAAASAPVPVLVAVPMQVPAASIARPISLRDQLIARDAMLAGSLDRRVPRAGSRCSSAAGTYLDPQGEYGKRRRR